MAKKKTTEKALNIDNILFNCRDYLRAARNSGSFFEKRDMMLTLVFLRFIGEKYEDGIKNLKQTLKEQGLDPEDENIRAAFFDDATFADGTYNLPPEARWSTIISTPAPQLNVALDTALQRLEEEDPQLKGCFVKGTFTARNLAANDIKKIVDEVNKISHKTFGEEKDLIGRVYEYFLKEFAVNATKEEGEFYTPHDVVQLIATMIEPYDGTLYDPYEHFYAWRRVNEGDAVSTLPFAETETMIKGVYSPERFLEIFRDYIYFQDSIYDSDEQEIVCRYPQFFATRLLKQSIIKSVVEKSGKGGTYFGATGCGKTYTMAFLARQLALRCTDIPEIGSPTIILIVDRDELQKQGSKLFTKSKEFLNLGEVSVVKNRAQLRQELGARQSGGFYICTIQKFCDREDDKIGLINDRQNIICFSDEAHRTQLEHSKKIQFSKDADENMKAMVSKPYAKVLKEAFPHATFVGFTGTPIAETYQTFGDEIDRYTMDQAVVDGLTVSIKYHPRIAKVLLDNKKVKEIENYYKKCADDGATYEDIEASKKAMSSMEIILGEPSRLERLATDIHNHYVASCAGDPDRIQKAMVVCSNRKIAYALLQKFKDKYPEWFEEKKSPDGVSVTEEELKELKPMPFMAMVSSVGSNDEKDMYDYLGGVKNDKRSEELDAAFKQEKSNFSIVIVVDMWITGFDVPCLTYLYNDKPLKKHLLIQTISRVNRKYPGKEYGMVIDYIGIRDNMREAMKVYGGDTSVAPTADDVEQATSVFREELEVLKNMFTGYDLSPFLNPECDPIERYRLLAKAAEYVFVSTEELQSEGNKGVQKVSFKTYYLKTVKRMRAAFDICQPSGYLGEEESALAQCFMAIAGFVRKMSGTSEVDADTMNRAVSKMVEEALKYNQVESVLESGEEEDIFSPEYFEKLSDVKMPATKLELLVKMLRKQIKEYGKVNQLAAKSYQEMLEKTIAEYHERRKHLTAEEAGEAQEQASEDVIKIATEQALAILRQMNENRESFRKIGLTFEEKAFYDILISLV